jgi:hypothetical protein
MTREEELEIQMVSKGKGGILDVSLIEHNRFFAMFEDDGENLCSRVTKGEVHFNIIDCWEPNACAAYNLNTVVVFRGMLEVIFAICARIVDNGIFPEFGNIEEKCPSIEPGASWMTKRELLNSLPHFSYDQAEHSWIGMPEREALFMFLSNTLFRFVVFHELGHIFNEHGKRSDLPSFFEFDEMVAEDRPGNADSQAREIIADTFAFQKLVEYQQRHLRTMVLFGNPVAKLLSDRFMRSQDNLVIFVAKMTYVYFYMMESPFWAQREPAQWSHPPAQFRLQAILAALMEHSLLSIPKERMPEIVSRCLVDGSSITAAMFNIESELTWMQTISGRKYSDHYQALFAIMPRWYSASENRWSEEQ